MLPLPKGEAVEGTYRRLGGKDDSRYAVLEDAKKNEFRIYMSGQLNYKFNHDLTVGDYVRVTYLGKREEPIEIMVDGKKKKVNPHDFKIESDRAGSETTTH